MQSGAPGFSESGQPEDVSAFPPKADVCGQLKDVREVPIADIDPTFSATLVVAQRFIVTEATTTCDCPRSFANFLEGGTLQP